jgi:bifunctional DNA primase/polymerase-like protein
MTEDTSGAPPANDVAAIAYRLLALEFSVIPIPRPRPGMSPGQPGDGKVPAIAWSEYQQRRPSVSEISAWFRAGPMNLAVITGQISGVVVVDADEPDALHWLMRRLPYTPWQTQTARGVHLWYRHPGVRVPNRARIDTGPGKLKIDIRGDGGFVIAPGSVHASGAAYVEAGDWNEPRARIPVFWPGWLTRPERRTRGAKRAPRPTDDQSIVGHDSLDRPVLDRARAYLAAITKPEIGHGSDADTLYAACRLVRGFRLSLVEAEDLLWEWAGGRPGWTREWVARKVAHAERYGTEPFGSLL